MIICVEISQRTKDELDRLIKEGGYRDYSEAVAMAVANQVLLHKGAAGTVPPSRLEVTADPKSDSSVDSLEDNSEPPSIQLPAGLQVPVHFSYHSLFGYSPKELRFRFAPYPSDGFLMGQEILADKWIFGQYNKLLPVKATCRALARVMCGPSVEGKDLALPKLASLVASDAVKLGDYLQHLDAVSNVHRDETLSLAFPHSDSPKSDKSRLRFANQFVGSITSQGILAGLPFELKLINLRQSGTPEVLLTEAGWQFAVMRNPIIDDARTWGKFSQEEIDFLLLHIRSRVPAEAFAYKVVLEAIAQGATTPDKLDDALEPNLPKRDAKPFTRAFLTTQRAGVVSRMIDLGLVQRIREGTNVTYKATLNKFEFSSPNPLRQVV